MMRKLLLVITLLFTLFSFSSSTNAQGISDRSQSPQQRYFKAKVIEIVEQGERDIAGQQNFFQVLTVQITDAPEKDKVVTIEHGGIFNITPVQLLKTGEQVILIKTIQADGNSTYSIMDKYRLNNVLFIAFGFFIFVLLVSGRKGLGSIVGLGISLAVILFFIVPQILAGKDPLLISITGSIVIMVVTIYLAHGFAKKTHVAVFSTALVLFVTGILSVLFVHLAKLSGLGSEDTFLLQFGPNAINLQGLLLGSMIIGALGVLDDVTNAQSAAVFELAKTDPKLDFVQLAERGFNIGREHVSSLVNTLVLAYAGASLGLFILFVLNPSNQPYWVILNSEVITEEIIRTLAGSFGLVLAVPVTTVLAAYFARGIKEK